MSMLTNGSPVLDASTRTGLSVSIMTHPARFASADGIAARLPDARVVVDPGGTDAPKSALRTALCAWRQVPPTSSHHLLVQDDVVLSPSLLERVRLGIELFPDHALAFYANWNSPTGAAVRLGAAVGATWVEAAFAEYFPCLAVVLPSRYIDDLVNFASPFESLVPNDDVVFGEFLRLRGVPALVSVPNFVEHLGMPSVAGNPGNGAYRSACFPAEDKWNPHTREAVAHSFDVCPHIYAGRSMFIVRGARGADREWCRVSLSRGARMFGVDVPTLRRVFTDVLTRHRWAARLSHRVGDAFAFAVWATAFNLGHLRRTGNVSVDVKTPGDLPGPHHADAALGSLAWGGRLHTFVTEPTLRSVADRMTQLAHDGFAHGVGHDST